jgi:4-carboxymuconolactone decarboxylase
MDDTERYDIGERIRRDVMGDGHVDRAARDATSLTADFQDFITRYAWGEVWNRPGLDRRSRSMVTLGVLITLRAEKEIAVHVRGALRNGLSPDEIKEVILHAAIYAGVPAAMDAFRVAETVMEDG